MKAFCLFIFIFSLNLNSEASELDNLYKFSNQSMDVVTHMDAYPNDGRFHLNSEESDLAKAVGINDHMIGEFAAMKTQAEIDCLQKQKEQSKLSEEYGSRDYRIAALSVTSNNANSKKNDQDFYNFSEYAKFMKDKGYMTLNTSYFGWEKLMSRFKDYDPKAGADVNAEKLAKYMKNTTGIVIPNSVLASEFMYRDLVKNPDNWKEILSKSKSALSFHEKIRLVAKLGGKFQEHYDKERIKTTQGGIIPLNKLLENISTTEYAGVCRDIALGQVQMLEALGVKNSYVIGYASNNGKHATVIASDPDDPDIVIKMNYGQLFTDDEKKGLSALEQDSSLPNMGLSYRIYDSKGKPVTEVRSELGSIISEVTNQAIDPRITSKSYSLKAVSIGSSNVVGSVFSGETSAGEKIVGVSAYGDASSERFTAKASMAAYRSEADKTYYDIGAESIYLQGRVGVKNTLYEGKYGNFKTEVGANVELVHINSKSISKSNDHEFRKTVMDGGTTLYTKIGHDVELSEKDKIALEIQSSWRVEQGNVADAKSIGLTYDTTTLISSYDHKYKDELSSSLKVATTLSEYGESVSFMAGLKQGKNKYSVGASAPTGDAPSYLPGQQESIKAAFERETDDWNFRLLYEENLDSGAKSISGSAARKF